MRAFVNDIAASRLSQKQVLKELQDYFIALLEWL
jgi:hypothetical protein